MARIVSIKITSDEPELSVGLPTAVRRAEFVAEPWLAELAWPARSTNHEEILQASANGDADTAGQKHQSANRRIENCDDTFGAEGTEELSKTFVVADGFPLGIHVSTCEFRRRKGKMVI